MGKRTKKDDQPDKDDKPEKDDEAGKDPFAVYGNRMIDRTYRPPTIPMAQIYPGLVDALFKNGQPEVRGFIVVQVDENGVPRFYWNGRRMTAFGSAKKERPQVFYNEVEAKSLIHRLHGYQKGRSPRPDHVSGCEAGMTGAIVYWVSPQNDFAAIETEIRRRPSDF